MITLNVFFRKHNSELNDGAATLYENLITNNVELILDDDLLIGEITAFIRKAVKQLKLRYNEVKTNINWETINKLEESEK